MCSTLLRALLFAIILIGPAFASGTVEITGAWSRATPPSASTGVVYLTITDHGAPDRLISASSAVADAVTLHQNATKNGVMQMRSVDGLDIPPEIPVKLEPDGYHLMLTGLKRPLKQGEHFPLTLDFQQAGAIQVSVDIGTVGTATAPDAGMGKMDGMPGMK